MRNTCTDIPVTATDAARILADDAILPLRAGADNLSHVSGLLAGIIELSRIRTSPNETLKHIEGLAACGLHLANSYADYLELASEVLETHKAPALVAAFQGGAHD